MFFCFALILLSQLYSRILLPTLRGEKPELAEKQPKNNNKYQGHNLENNTTFANNIAD